MSYFSYRDTWSEVSLDAIYENVLLFKNSISNRTKLMAVVKADGYGHGAIEVSKIALEAGADYLGVAILDEALVIRKAGINKPTLVLGYTPPRSIETAIKNDITLTVYCDEVLDEIISISSKLNKTVKVHIKVDTGMGRVGVTTPEQALSLAIKATNSKNIQLEGIFTHLANADSGDSTYTNEQFSSFNTVVDFLERNKIKIPIKHCCNSAGTMNFPNMHLDMVRVGISLYGLLPSYESKNDAFPLKQAMQLKSKVSSLKKLPAGKMISYGCTYTTHQKTVIATIPIGYADGLSRLLSNKGVALVEDKRVPIVGRICMDQSMIDVTCLQSVDVGTEVILFGGSSKASFISIDEIAELMGTINYEVVCLIGKRVPRIYVNQTRPIAEQNKFSEDIKKDENENLALKA